MENGDIEVGEFWVGTSLPESLEVEHSFISSLYRQLLVDRSSTADKVSVESALLLSAVVSPKANSDG